MAYTPTEWKSGDVITAEKLNKIEEGIKDNENGYECVVAPTEIINEDVTTYTTPGPACQGNISYSKLIDADTITVEFNGQEYELTKYHNAQYEQNYYGGQDLDDFSQNPFVIQSTNSYNNLWTPNAETYSLKVVATVETISGTECFQKAVKFFGPNYVVDAEVEGGVLVNNVQINTVTAQYALAEGFYTTASGVASHAEGTNTIASGDASHAEGRNGTTASGDTSHAEGAGTIASGDASHAEGSNTTANGMTSHAEGYITIASGNYSHAEGYNTTASGNYSHAEGFSTTASGSYSHAEGYNTQAKGDNSHVEGDGTIAKHRSQHVFGEFNIEDPSTVNKASRGNYVEIVGNGAGSSRSNARTLDWNGNEVLQGSLTLGKGTADETTITATQLKALLALL